jgi:Rps23 Pro-64 3,4-dihydroxylase Tpa1-like proline 4-hydroxylase
MEKSKLSNTLNLGQDLLNDIIMKNKVFSILKNSKRNSSSDLNNNNFNYNENKDDRLFTNYNSDLSDSDSLNEVYRSESNSFEDTCMKKEEFLSSSDNSLISQCWYYSHNIEYFDKVKIAKGIYNICKYFYDLPEVGSLDNNELQLTYYDKGCRFTPHRDGATINLCSIIIYLNKDYKKENGGLLLLNGEEIVPEFGNIGFMDLSKHNISHGVTEVIGGPGRYAILDFPKLKSII